MPHLPEPPAAPAPDPATTAEPRVLTPAAQRALAEAEARRQAADSAKAAAQAEIGGRQGPDPVRYGDWETGGIATDF